MPTALLCTQASFDADLSHTVLWREGMERHVATRLEDARMMAVAARPDVILVDRDLPRAAKLVAQLREDAATRAVSLVVVARGDFDPGEVELLEAGANAILRLPAGPEWDERLTRLMSVPVRKEARFSVQFAVDAIPAPGRESVPALALNLSASGMLLESNVPLGIRDEIGLLFRLPSAPRPVSGMGRVVRQASPTQFGIEFTRLDGDGAAQVRRFVGQLGPRGA